MKKRQTVRDGPFRGLPELVRNAGLQLGAKPEPAPAPLTPEPPVEESEASLFEQAMAGVQRVDWRHERVPSPAPTPPEHPGTELEDRRLMEEAVNGHPALPVDAHPEYIEGWVGVAGRRFLPNLRNGNYSIQGQVDLHGLSQEEARMAVEEFVNRMSRFQSCCVKIIHGRGINSPSDRAVLKESLQRWLCTRRMARHVVAYASAPYSDGGVGALYVLLRK
jgi:DNA-nicking Smr family endonuclease